MGFETHGALPVEMPEVLPVSIPGVEIPVNDDHVSWPEIITLFVKETIIGSILSMKGGAMDNDNKATVTGIATGIVALVGLFGLSWPVEVVTGIVTVGMMILGYFTNKKDVPATPAPAK